MSRDETARPDPILRRVLQCAVHGSRRWRGHIMCDACGQTYQTTDARRPDHAPETCRCGHPLLPPVAERVGDVFGLRTGGVLLDGEGRPRSTPTYEGTDWTARPICYLCHRRVAKHHGGRVPVDRDRD